MKIIKLLKLNVKIRNNYMTIILFNWKYEYLADYVATE